ncbi:MAG: nitroreductase family protein [Chloroflexota bacterium]
MSDKIAVTSQPILDAIAKRWSPRAFADKPISADTLTTLFEAARWTASAFNEQPWRFIVGSKDNPEAHKKVLSCFMGFNQEWGAAAPVVLLAVASTQFTRNDKVNNHAWYDVGQAMSALSIQAAALDLYIHQMAGIDPEKAIDVFSIPEGFQPVTGAAIGYLGDPAQLSDQMKEREQASRERKALSEIVFQGEWG